MLPLLAALAANAKLIIHGAREPRNVFLVAFGLLAMMISAWRLEYWQGARMLLLAATLLWLRIGDIHVSASLMKTLLALTAPFAILAWLAGINPFSLIAGMPNSIGNPFRVSIFPTVATSSIFALLVFLYVVQEKGPWTIYRKVVAAFSLYLIIFSLLKTTVVALALFGFFSLSMHALPNRFKLSPQAVITVLLLLFTTTVAVEHQWHASSNAPATPLEEDAESLTRFDIWSFHISTWLEKPIAGAGNYTLYEGLDKGVSSGNTGIGSEAFLTDLLARLGLCALPFFLHLYVVLRENLLAKDWFRCGLFLALMVYMLTYGSFLHPANFLLLLWFAGLNPVSAVKKLTSKPAHGELAAQAPFRKER